MEISEPGVSLKSSRRISVEASAPGVLMRPMSDGGQMTLPTRMSGERRRSGITVVTLCCLRI